jgi:hypothetical protein
MLFTNNKPEVRRPDLNKSHLETINERVHRHLKDRNSEITDEDIRNAVIELNIQKNVYEDFLALLPQQ